MIDAVAALHPQSLLLGWTLTHALWQTVLVSLIFIAWRAWSRVSVGTRYRVAAGALLACATAAITTFAGLASIRPLAVSSSGATAVTSGATVLIAPVTDRPAAAAPAPARSRPFPLPDAEEVLDVLAAAWAIGVLVLAVRFVGGLLLARRIRRRARPITSEPLHAMCARLASSLGIARRIELLESADVDAPATLGFLRCAILLPRPLAGTATTEALEPLVAHELAHIQAGDYAANLVQTALDVPLFFCPGARWLSAEIRRLREYRCDDVALSVYGDRVGYLGALAKVAEASRPSLLLPAPGINGPRLADRMRRVVEGETMRGLSPMRRVVLTFLIAVIATAGAWLMAASRVHARHNATAKSASAPTTFSGRAALPLTASTYSEGSPVRIEAVHSTDDYLFESVKIRNVSEKTVTSVHLVSFFETNAGSKGGPRTIVTTHPIPVDLKPGATIELKIGQAPVRRRSVRPIPDEEKGQPEKMEPYQHPMSTGVGPTPWLLGFGGVLEFKKNAPKASGHIDVFQTKTADGTTWGHLEGRVILLTSCLAARTSAESTDACVCDYSGDPNDGPITMKVTNGFPVPTNDGRWAYCKNGRWVELPK
jgi:beta-lactamase regulating signal transducer with metallopeptidase domain